MPKKKPEKVDLNELFPYNHHNIRLEIPEENKICWFKDTYDTQKYISKNNLDKKKIILNEKPSSTD